MTEEEVFLLDQIEQAVFVLEPDARGIPCYAAFNTFARNILGRPLSDILGKNAEELYGGRMGRVTLERHKKALATGETTIHEVILPLGDGERMICTVLRPIVSDSGNVTRIVATSKDETERHTLREMRNQMHAATHENEQFVNLAAHDLRAPMRHVATLAAMMREDFQDLDPERLELIDLLEDVGAKALSLIGDVLSHAEAGSAKEDIAQFNLADLVDEIRSTLDPFRTINVTMPDAMIKSDRTAFQIILRNLIDNAMKYAQNTETSECLALEIALTTISSDRFELRLSDNGQGFSDAALDKLSTGEFTNESGYGMMAIRRLVQSRGGSLHVANREVGTGAEIRVQMPGQWYEDGYGPAAAYQGN